MMKRKDFMLGATFGLVLAAGATAGGVIDWPTANAGPVAGKSGRLVPNAGGAGLAFAPPQGAPLSFADIVQQVAPAVVQIDVVTRIEPSANGLIQVPGLPFAIPTPPAEEGEDGGIVGAGAGSGFFISADGYIVTNNHVIEDATEITVKLADSRELTARVIGRDEATDLAVIKVDGSDFPFVTFEEEAQPRVGDWVVAVGNPFGLGGTATAGIVSAQGRGIDASTPYTDYLQIDAAINRGSSGGPTFDIYGRVIGVNSAIYSPTGNSVGIGFAIPASVAKPITDRLMRGETIERGYIGVTIGDLDANTAKSLGLPADTKGALVNTVESDGPAAAAGLQFADVIVAMNGDAIDGSNELTRRVGTLDPGQTVRLEYLRDGRRRTATLRLGTRPSASDLNERGEETPGSSGSPSGPRSSGSTVMGLNVTPLTAAQRERINAPASVEGLLVTGAEANGDRRFRSGGVVIQRVGSIAVRTPADLQGAVEAARRAGQDSLLLMVWSPGSGSGAVVVELPDPE